LASQSRVMGRVMGRVMQPSLGGTCRIWDLSKETPVPVARSSPRAQTSSGYRPRSGPPMARLLRHVALAALLLTQSLNGQQRVELLTQATDVVFDEVSSAAFTPDGNILVADRVGRYLALVDLEGGSVDTLAAQGRGPDEYADPALVVLAGESVAILDQGNMKVLRLHPERRLHFDRSLDSFARAAGSPLLLPTGFDASGAAYAALRTSLTEREQLLRLAPRGDGIEVSTIAELAGAPPSTSVQEGQSGQFTFTRQVRAFEQRDSWAVAQDGRVLLARAEPYRVEWLGPTGQTTTGPIVEFEPVAVRSAEKEAWLAARERRSRRAAMSFGGAPTGLGSSTALSEDDVQWPEHKPPFPRRGVSIDVSGRGWIERHVPAGESRLYDVVDRSGGVVLQVRVPPRQRIVAFGPGSVLLAALETDFGFERLHVATLP